MQDMANQDWWLSILAFKPFCLGHVILFFNKEHSINNSVEFLGRGRLNNKGYYMPGCIEWDDNSMGLSRWFFY